MAERRLRVAVVYGTPAGTGGLGLQASTAIAALAKAGYDVHAVGPGRTGGWPLSELATGVTWVDVGDRAWLKAAIHTPLRWYPGIQIHCADWLLGRWAARQLEWIRPDVAYFFTQVALEGLHWCKQEGVPTILDNPNGGIANFQAVCEREWTYWCGGRHKGHPTDAMVARVHEEYRLADRIRVSSTWASESTAKEVSDPSKLFVVDQPLDLTRFRPCESRVVSPALNVVYVGSIDVRKGVLRFLRAVRGASTRLPIRIVLVGGTGSRAMRSALHRESAGLDVTLAPGDPVHAYQAADISVLPTLEDGFGFVVSEALGCGLPVIVTDQSGAAEWVREAKAGWVVPAEDERAMTSAVEAAITSRLHLAAMGARGRRYVEQRAGARCFLALSEVVATSAVGRVST